ncbi:Putative uncharacterized protein (plasmid) [Lactococcus lactis subsp. lactis]|nr:Putative uncharacterized protein [Lactococcus lactis subsp. lactis]
MGIVTPTPTPPPSNDNFFKQIENYKPIFQKKIIKFGLMSIKNIKN